MPMENLPASSDGQASAGPVWIVDDDDIRYSISFALSPRYSPYIFESCEEFLKKVKLDQPGCLILDLRMNSVEGLNGMALQQRLLDAKSPIGVVFLSAHGDVRTAVAAMESGAVSFLEKTVDPDLLIEAVRRALDISEKRARRQRMRELLGTLTNRELQIFRMVCQGFRNTDIAETLFISARTVEVHRTHISRKLGIAAPVRFLYELAEVEELFTELGVPQTTRPNLRDVSLN